MTDRIERGSLEDGAEPLLQGLLPIEDLGEDRVARDADDHPDLPQEESQPGGQPGHVPVGTVRVV